MDGVQYLSFLMTVPELQAQVSCENYISLVEGPDWLIV